MSRYFRITLLLFFVLITACKQKMINYPYAENNKTTMTFFNTEVEDDYKWMDIDPAKSHALRSWLNQQEKLSSEYFRSSSDSVFKRIKELTSFPRYSLIGSCSGDALYYVGIYPYTHKIDIYKYNNGKNELLKQLVLPFHVEMSVKALIFDEERYIAVISKDSSGINKNIYVYDLNSEDNNAIHMIPQVRGRELIAKGKSGFFFIRDQFESPDALPGINNIYHCRALNGTTSGFIESEYYTDEMGSISNVFDIVYDHLQDQLFIGKYDIMDPEHFKIHKIYSDTKSPELLCSLSLSKDQDLRLAGTDDVNLYIISKQDHGNGSLIVLNKQTLKADTLISHPYLNLSSFSQINGHAVISLRNQSENHIYFINKHNLKINKQKVPSNYVYNFNHNIQSSKIYYSKESQLAPKEIYQLDSIDSSRRFKVNDKGRIPFNAEDYVIENHSVRSPEGEEQGFQVIYKKDTPRDGSSPLIMHCYDNAGNFYEDIFHYSRILYLEQGYIFVQKASSCKKTAKDVRQRADDMYAVYQYLLKNNYSSKSKIGLIGRELGASVVLTLLNKYPVKSPSVLIDGIYDFIDGKKAFISACPYYLNDSVSFRNSYEQSPYYGVVNNKNYPPVLLMANTKTKASSVHDTYRLAARLQMRTRAYHPVIMLTNEQVEEFDRYDEYTYNAAVEHSLLFLNLNLNVYTD